MVAIFEKFAAEMTRIAKENGIVFKRIAAAVSGGADSLALAFLLRNYAREFPCHVVILTVNHHLRPEADIEADDVAALMEKWGVEHHILNWFPQKLTGSLEEKARNARYELMEKWCVQNDMDCLLTAHHQKDQAETFLIRLQRGSGVDGLAAMSEFSRRGRINLVRPLLGIDPAELRELLQRNAISWAEDKSNQCDDFLRVRIRKFLPELENKTGISPLRLAETARALGDVKKYFEEQTAAFIEQYVRCFEKVAVSVSPSVLNELHPQLRVRVLSRLIRQVGGRMYPPGYEELQRLMQMLSDAKFRGCTLGGCEIVPFQKRLWVIREQSSKKNIGGGEWEAFVQRCPYYATAIVPHSLKCLLIAKEND